MEKEKMSKSAASGIVALIFLIVGFQIAIFVEKIVKMSHEPSESEVVDNRGDSLLTAIADGADCAAIGKPGDNNDGSAGNNSKNRVRYEKYVEGRTSGGGYKKPQSQYNATRKRTFESFVFNPNTVSISDLIRLGLTEKQAGSIDNYRKKGGVFRKKDDFARMYVVSDTLFQRLEPYIDIPKLELNGADTSALKTLPGIGSYYAGKIVEYRELLGGFVELDQLEEISGFGHERFEGLKDYAEVDTSGVKPYALWTLEEKELAGHPYIGNFAAKGIIRFKACTDSAMWNLDNLVANGILTESNVKKLKRYCF